VIAALRCRHYDSANTAKVVYEAEGLTPLDAATTATRTGASFGSVIRHSSVATVWTPVMGLRLATGAYFTHTGTYRIRARVYSDNGPAVSLRMIWGLGDLSFPVINDDDAKALPGASNFYLLDLGEVRLDPAPVGTHRWDGQIQAKGAAGGEVIDIDKIWLEPVDEGHAILRATPTPTAGLTSYSLRDDFNQSAGALNGKALSASQVIAGPNSGGTFANDSSVGTVAWSNPGNAVADDGSEASAYLGPLAVSQYLKVTNFFGSNPIPSGATINGIKVEVKRHGEPTCADVDVHIVKGGTIQTANRNSSTAWPFTGAYQTYGGETDLWGATWLYSDINLNTFGFVISAYGNGWVYIDHIRITVYYTPSGGGAWAIGTGGDADDFNVSGTPNFNVTRTAVSDTAGIQNAGFEIAGSTIFTATAAQITTGSSLANGDARRGLVLRYTSPTSTGSYLICDIQPSTGNLTATLRGFSTSTLIYQSSFSSLKAAGPFTLSVIVTAGGRVFMFINSLLYGVAENTGLATGGTQASGKVGVWDLKTSGVAETRTYDGFAAWVPSLDTILSANLSAELRTDGNFRESSGGGSYRPTQPPIGDLLRMPAGFEGRTVELLLHPSRGDFDQVPDSALSSLSVTGYYSPSWLYVPEP
jgi:hypothetical protein